jgi:hypothetical protein
VNLINIITAAFRKEQGGEHPDAGIISQYFYFNNSKEMGSAVCQYSKFLKLFFVCILVFWHAYYCSNNLHWLGVTPISSLKRIDGQA